MICFEYVNAVWYLEYEIFSYVSGGQAMLDSVYCKSFFSTYNLSTYKAVVYLVNVLLGSHSYLHAIRDVHFFFSNGLCCDQNSFTEDNKVNM